MGTVTPLSLAHIPDTPDPVPDSEKTFTWAEVQRMVCAARQAGAEAALACYGLESPFSAPVLSLVES